MISALLIRAAAILSAVAIGILLYLIAFGDRVAMHHNGGAF